MKTCSFPRATSHTYIGDSHRPMYTIENGQQLNCYNNVNELNSY